MGQILSQEEVDALLKGVVGGEVETEAGGAKFEAGPAGEARQYDFTAQDKVIRGRMPTLDAINDRFARFFRTTLSNMLRRMVDVTTVALDTLKFGNFIRSLPVPSSIHIVHIEPLRGNALVVMETKLVFALVDSFFGGRGKGGTKVEGREFTAIEQHMLFKVVNSVIKEWSEAWQPVYQLEMNYVRSEMNPQFAGIIPNEDVLIVVQCEIEMEEVTGNLMLCMPYMLIEPIRDRLYASFHAEEKVNVDTNWLKRLTQELMTVPVELVVDLGVASITGRDLSSLKKGDVIVLEQDIGSSLQVKVQGLPKYLALPGRVKDNMAVEVRKIVESESY